MVLDGDIDKLSGLSVSVGGSGGAGGGTGGVSFIWDITSATPIGVAFELGVGAGPALEGYLQGTLGGRNEPVVAE